MRPGRGRRGRPTPQCSPRPGLGTGTVHASGEGSKQPGQAGPASPKWVPHVAPSSTDDDLWLHKTRLLDACLGFLQPISIVNAVSSPCEGAGFLQPSPSQTEPTPAICGRQDPPRPQLWETAPIPGHPSQPTAWGGHRCPTAPSRQFSRWCLCPSSPNRSAPAICILPTAIRQPLPQPGAQYGGGGRVGGRLYC